MSKNYDAAKRAIYRKKYRKQETEYLRKWRSKNPERARESALRHYQKNKFLINARRRDRYANDPQRRFKHKLLNLSWYYGLTSQKYQEMVENQKGKCAICSCEQRDIGRALYVDHDHVNGKVRGLLCHDCNVALGMAKESPDRLRKMATYIEEHNAKIS